MRFSSPEEELRGRIALGLIKGMKRDALAKIQASDISAGEFFEAPTHDLAVSLGIDVASALPVDERVSAYARAEAEAKFVSHHHIKVYLVGEKEYPARLAETDDPPVMIFKLGEASLSPRLSLCLVGTRNATPYGVDFCDKGVEALAKTGVETSVVSGLAYGIDAAAHTAALRHGLPTVAVVAHGLDTIYPAAHRGLARNIIASGGAIVTEYPTGTKPFKPRFLRRNRLIAALSDLTVVVESDIKGGALSTARHAYECGRTIAALPGNISEKYSAGCNRMIARGRANMICEPADLLRLLGLNDADAVQTSFLPELPADVTAVLRIMERGGKPMSPDEILPRIELHMNQLLPLLNEMELDGYLVRHPGNRFSLSV